MMGVLGRQHRHAMLAREQHQIGFGARKRDLGKAISRIGREHRGGAALNTGFSARIDPTGLHALHITTHPLDTVAPRAVAFGRNHDTGHRAGVFLSHSAIGEHGGNKFGQCFY